MQTFVTWEFPRSMTCDNGQPFSSAEFKEFYSSYSIEIFHAPPPCPQANGLVGRQTSGIKKRLQISKASSLKSWQDDLLIDYLVMYRSTPQDRTEKSPSSLCSTER
jgi:transposase InsO family protein